VTRRLLYLSGLAILAVILFHAAGIGFVAMFAWSHRYAPATADPGGSASYWALRGMEQVSVFSIPAFMFVSGYFTAFATGRSRHTLGWDAVGARIKYLLIPYTVWTLALFAFAFIQGRRPGLDGYLVMYLTGGASPAYYYVPLLIQLYLLAPFLIPVARNRPLLLLVVTGLIQIAVQLTYYPALLGATDPALLTLAGAIPKWLFITRIFWFCAGMTAGFHLSGFKSLLSRYKWVLASGALLLIPLGMIEWEILAAQHWPEWLAHHETFLDTLYSIGVIGSVLAFSDARLPLPGFMEDLGGKTYGIYLIHLPVMESTARAVYHFAPALLGYQLVLQPLVIAVGLAVPLGLMALVSRSPASRYYRYLFG